MVQNQFISWRRWWWWCPRSVWATAVAGACCCRSYFFLLRATSRAAACLPASCAPPFQPAAAGAVNCWALRQLASMTSKVTWQRPAVRKSVRAESLSFRLATCLWRVIFGLMSQKFTEIYKSFLSKLKSISATHISTRLAWSCTPSSKKLSQFFCCGTDEQTGLKTIKYFQSQQQHLFCTTNIYNRAKESFNLYLYNIKITVTLMMLAAIYEKCQK